MWIIVRAARTQHNTAEFLLDLPHLNSDSRAPGASGTGEPPHFTLQQRESRSAGGAAAREKGDAAGAGGGQPLAEAGSAADDIALTGISSETFSHVFIFVRVFAFIAVSELQS